MFSPHRSVQCEAWDWQRRSRDWDAFLSLDLKGKTYTSAVKTS